MGIRVDSDIKRMSQKEIIEERPEEYFLEGESFKKIKNRLYQFMKFSDKALSNKC